MAKTFVFFAFIATLILANCAPPAQYQEQLLGAQPPSPGEQENVALKEQSAPMPKAKPSGYAAKKAFRFDDAEAVGYLDNPAPVAVSQPNAVSAPPPQAGNSASGSHAAQAFQQKQKTREKTRRLVTYEGSITTRCHGPDSVIDLAIKLSSAVNGYVESRDNASVTLRVPLAEFDTVYNELLKIGEIVDFSKSAEDITDAFQDAELRMQILNKTIQRYVKLVNQVKNESEKLGLLKEIENLREQLEILEVQKKTLSLRAEFAKITLSVIAVAPGGAVSLGGEIRGFDWIHRLDPFSVTSLGKYRAYAVPEGMVRIKSKDVWLVESADGTKVWSSRLPNFPDGDATFWIKAVRERLKADYGAADTSSIQDYKVIRFTPYPGSNYIYVICLCVKKDSIYVIQAYFPDEKQEQRYTRAFRSILGKVRS